MKPIIAFDMDGTIISSEAASKAHKEWFKVVALLLKDPSVEKLADKADYFPDVLTVMERLTGLRRGDSFHNQVMTKYARNLYQMMYLAELQKEGEKAFVPDMIDMLIELKTQCRLAMITTAPEDMVLPALEIGGVKELFDYIYRSPLTSEPSKLEMLKKFIKEVGKPALYVGNEKKDAEACKELGIKFALSKWAKHDEEAENMASFNLDTPKQLQGIIKLV
jgi:phosphoglycolate phosphatase-like HAD superfamily hydrolase